MNSLINVIGFIQLYNIVVTDQRSSCSFFIAWIEISCCLISTISCKNKQFLEVSNILFTCANVWIVFIDLFLEITFKAKLPSKEVKRGHKHPHIDEAWSKGTSQCIKAHLQVYSHALGHCGSNSGHEESCNWHHLRGDLLKVIVNCSIR